MKTSLASVGSSSGFARRALVSGVVLGLALVSAGCEQPYDGPPRPTGEGVLGVPDEEHGPSTPTDIDGDGVMNDEDFCPSLANAEQLDICTYDAEPPAATGVVEDDGVARLNFWREQLGLEDVTADAAQTAGCVAHLTYLQACAEQMGGPFLSHGEDDCPELATEAGAAAGADSVLSYGEADIGAAVDGWLDTLYHRLPLIHPGLQTVGVAQLGPLSCVQYRPGTAAASAPHPILWPVADSPYTHSTFGGNESPCPTIENPTGGGECPGGAAIASIGLHGHTLANATGRITRLDTGDELPLVNVFFDGGPTEHEQQGFLEGSIALVPEPGTELTRAIYEAQVDVQVDGTATTYRWRFGTGAIDQMLGCAVFGDQSTFANATAVTLASFNGRLCADETSDFYRIQPVGTFRATLQYDRRAGQLELVAYDAERNEIAVSMEHDGTEMISGIPSMGYIEVRGAGGTGVGGYILAIEAD